MDQSYKESQLNSRGNESFKSTKNRKGPIKIKLERELTQASEKFPEIIIKNKRSRSHSRNKDNEYNSKRSRNESRYREYREHRYHSIKNHAEVSHSSKKKKEQNYHTGYGSPTPAVVRENSEKRKEKSCYGDQNDTKRKEIYTKIKGLSRYDEQTRAEVKEEYQEIKGQGRYGKQALQSNNFLEVKGQNYYDKQIHSMRRKELRDISGHNVNTCGKPCSYFNRFGKCRFISGHFPPKSGGFIKQFHICSCCHEFLNEDRFHSAVDCDLKKKVCEGTLLLSPKANSNIANSKLPGMPCNSFNFGKCVLKSGHWLRRRDIRVLHICNFCLEYRGERNYHSQEECKLKKKLIIEVENQCQPIKDTRYDQVELNSLKERTDGKFICGEQTVKVLPKLRIDENLKEPGQLKSTNALGICLMKEKTCKDSEKYAQVGSKMNKDLLEQEATTKAQFDIRDKVKHIVKQTLYSNNLKMKTEELNSETSIFPKIEIKDEVPYSEIKVKSEVKSERDIYFTSECKNNWKFCTNAEYFEMGDGVEHIYIKTEGTNYTEELKNTLAVDISPDERDFKSSILCHGLKQ